MNTLEVKHYKNHMVCIGGIYKRRGIGRPLRSQSLALEVLALKNQGLTIGKIADRFGWAKQEDYITGRKTLSRTVSNYLRIARGIMEQQSQGIDVRPRGSFKY